MPTYEYACASCGHNFEQFQLITARPLRKCPRCGEDSLQRLIGAGGGIIFRGSGFYQTDYRSESYKKGAAAEQKASAGSDGGTKSTKGPAPHTTKKPRSNGETAAA